MRECLRKSKQRVVVAEKEVRLTVRRAGVNVDGEQRWQMIFGFYNGAEKKISSTNFAAVDVDFEENRIYFVETDDKEGWKLAGSKNVRELSLTIYDADVWRGYEGEYNLLKDRVSGDYYIDLVNKEDK